MGLQSVGILGFGRLGFRLSVLGFMVSKEFDALGLGRLGFRFSVLGFGVIMEFDTAF